MGVKNQLNVNKVLFSIFLVLLLSSTVLAVNDPGHDSLYLQLIGGTLSGALTVNSYLNVTGNVYVGGNLIISGDTNMSGTLNMLTNKIINLANGTDSQDAVTKSQLDAVNSSFSGDLSGYVPYTSAISNVDLGSYNLTTTGTISIGSNNVQQQVLGSCTYGIASVAENGTITCATQQGTGDVVGPSSNGFQYQIPYFDDTTGKNIAASNIFASSNKLWVTGGGTGNTPPNGLITATYIVGSGNQNMFLMNNTAKNLYWAVDESSNMYTDGSITADSYVYDDGSDKYYSLDSQGLFMWSQTNNPLIEFAGVTKNFQMGMDNSANEDFEISRSTLSANDDFLIDALTGDITIGENLSVIGGITIGTTLNMTSGKITNLANGTDSQDAVTKSQLDAVSGSIETDTDTWWNITGSNYLINSSNILELNETTLNTTIDARVISGVPDVWVNTSGDTMTGHLTMSGTSANIILGSNYLSGDGDDEGIFVTSAGRIGIGTTNPEGILTIRTSTTGRVIIAANGTDTNQDSPKLSFFGGSAASITGPSIQKISSGGYGRGRLAFFQHDGGDYTSETEVMSLLYTGILGIGNTNPTTAGLVINKSISGAGIDMSSSRIINLANGTLSQDAVTKSQLDAINDSFSGDLSGYVPYTSATSNVDLGSYNLTTTGTISIGSNNVQQQVLGSCTYGIASVAENGTITCATQQGTGDVVGPSSATDNAIARFDGSTGKLIQSSTMARVNDNDMFYTGTISPADPSALTYYYNAFINSGSNGFLNFVNNAVSATFTVGNDGYVYTSSDIEAGGDIYGRNIILVSNASIGGTLDMTSGKIINLANGTLSQDAVTLSQLQAVNSTLGGDLANYVPYSGADQNVNLGIYNLTTTGNIKTHTLKLENDNWISANNSAGTGTINMFKVNSANQIEVGAPLNIGSFEFTADSGLVTFVDMPVTSASSVGSSQSYVFKVDRENIMTIYSEADGSGGIQNKRVGIGTTTPTHALHVVGDANITGNIYSNGVLLTPDTDTFWNITTSQYLENRSGVLDVNETELNATITSLVSTTVPDVWVNTSGDTMTGNLSMGGNYIQNLANGTDSQDAVTKSQLDAINASFSGDLSGYVPYTDATSNVNLGANNFTVDTNVLHVDSTNDRVGIGTTPTEKLEIKSGIINILNSGADGSVNEVWRTQLANYAGTSNWRNSIYSAVSSNPSQSILKFSLSSSQTTQVDVMTLLGSGNVGIGTTTPNSKLHVNGNSTFNGTMYLNSNKITNLANGTLSQDAVTFSQLQAINSTLGGDLANYVPYTGATADVNLADYNLNLTNITYTGKIYQDEIIMSVSPSATGYYKIATTEIDTWDNVQGVFELRWGTNQKDGYILFSVSAKEDDYSINVLSSSYNTLQLNSIILSISNRAMTGIPTRELFIYIQDKMLGTPSIRLLSGEGFELEPFVNTAQVGQFDYYSCGVTVGNSCTKQGYILDVNDYWETNKYAFIDNDLEVSGTIYGTLDGLNISNLVPYTAATADLNLGSYNFITTSGFIGVNKAVPRSPLHIVANKNAVLTGDSNLHFILEGSADTANQGPGIGFRSSSNPNDSIGAKIVHIRQGSYSQGDLAFYTKESTSAGSPVERLRIKFDGKVGIGTASPTQLLDINGTAIIRGTLDLNSNKITNLANGTLSQDAVTFSQLQAVNSTLGGDLANYVPYTSATNNLDLNNKNLTSVSYVGVGTATPNANLQVNGTFNATNNGGSITLDSNGDVRIGI